MARRRVVGRYIVKSWDRTGKLRQQGARSLRTARQKVIREQNKGRLTRVWDKRKQTNIPV